MLWPSERKCFVAAPIGARDSTTRERSDRVLDRIIRPAIEPLGFTAVRLDRLPTPGRLSYQAGFWAIAADLMVADLTDGNANVLYEVGIRHTIGKPCVQLIENGGQIPFDVADLRTVFVDSGSPHGIERAVTDLASHVAAVMSAPPTPEEILAAEYLLGGYSDWLTDPRRSDPSGGLPVPTLILSELQGKLAERTNLVHLPRWMKLDHLVEPFRFGEQEDEIDTSFTGEEELPIAA